MVSRKRKFSAMQATSLPARRAGSVLRRRRRRINFKQVSRAVPYGGPQMGLRSVSFPAKQRFKLRWNLAITETQAITNGGSSAFTIKLNNAYRPSAATTDSPRGYSQWVNFYERYIVRGCKIKILCWNESSSAHGINVGFVCRAGTSSAITNYLDYAELPDSNFRFIGKQSGKIEVMRKYVSIKKLFGLSGLDISDFSAPTSGTDPTRVAYLDMAINYAQQWVSADINNAKVHVVVILDLYGEFYDRKAIGD